MRERYRPRLCGVLYRFRAQPILLTALGPPLFRRPLIREKLVHLRVLAATGGQWFCYSKHPPAG
jgi:hypothetical protein